jgi:hypothetical protein
VSARSRWRSARREYTEPCLDCGLGQTHVVADEAGDGVAYVERAREVDRVQAPKLRWLNPDRRMPRRVVQANEGEARERRLGTLRCNAVAGGRASDLDLADLAGEEVSAVRLKRMDKRAALGLPKEEFQDRGTVDVERGAQSRSRRCASSTSLIDAPGRGSRGGGRSASVWVARRTMSPRASKPAIGSSS